MRDATELFPLANVKQLRPLTTTCARTTYPTAALFTTSPLLVVAFIVLPSASFIPHPPSSIAKRHGSPPVRCWGAWATSRAALALQEKDGLLAEPCSPTYNYQSYRCVGVRRLHDGRDNGAASPAVGEPCSGRVVRGGGGRVVLATSTTAANEGDKGNGDIWRDSALRYAGYANEVGESFRNIAPRLVVPSYAVSIAYVCGDTVDKAYKDYSDGKGVAAVGKTGFDVLLWQTLASVAVPGLTINLVVKAMAAAMSSDQAKNLLPKLSRKWFPTAVGLGIIPFIVHPIDEAVSWGMDESVRKWLA